MRIPIYGLLLTTINLCSIAHQSKSSKGYRREINAWKTTATRLFNQREHTIYYRGFLITVLSEMIIQKILPKEEVFNHIHLIINNTKLQKEQFYKEINLHLLERNAIWHIN